MGFPCLALKMTNCISFIFVLNLLSHFKIMIRKALAHLDLLKPSEQAYSSYSDEYSSSTSGYVLLVDGLFVSQVSIQELTALIKKKLLAMEYGNFIIKRLGVHKDESNDDDTVCTVCLNHIERSQEIRELRNCCHVFHRECLDAWVDEGQVTCPLCRSLLYPPNGCLPTDLRII